MLQAIILSFGAADALVPLIIIIILIAAAAGVTRGWDALGKLFGISVLAGIGAGAAAKGSLSRKSGFKAGAPLGNVGLAVGSNVGGAVAAGVGNTLAQNAAFAGELAAAGAAGAAGGAGAAAAGAAGINAAAMGTGGRGIGGMLGASRAGIAGIPGKPGKFVKMAVMKGGKAMAGAGTAVLTAKNVEKLKKGAGAAGRFARGVAGKQVGTPLSKTLGEEISGMSTELAGNTRLAGVEREIFERRLGMLREKQQQLNEAIERYKKTQDAKAFRKEFSSVWRSTRGGGFAGAKLSVWNTNLKGEPEMTAFGGLGVAGAVGRHIKNRMTGGAGAQTLREGVLAGYARGARLARVTPSGGASAIKQLNALGRRERFQRRMNVATGWANAKIRGGRQFVARKTHAGGAAKQAGGWAGRAKLSQGKYTDVIKALPGRYQKGNFYEKWVPAKAQSQEEWRQKVLVPKYKEVLKRIKGGKKP